MSFCKFSSSYVLENKTVVDNIFINDFLPYAPDDCVKVYLFGLSRCSNASATDNNITNFANVLNMTVEEVEKAFMYWQEQGLVQVLSTKPIEVRYLPISSNLGNVKKYKVDKYTDFNLQIQEILNERLITPTEYAEYYEVIENCHIEPEALLMIAKYCADLKGSSVRYHYINTVAKNWEKEGVRTSIDVENKIQELGVLDDKVSIVLSAMGTKRKVQLEDVQMLNCWLDEFDFELNTIVYVAKRLSAKKKIDILYLNNILLKYYEMKLLSIQEIEEYENNKQEMFDIAKSVVKNLGLYYEDLTKVVDTYILSWQQMGYGKEILESVSDYCFKSSIRTLEGLNDVILKFFKLGITTLDAFEEYLTDIVSIDNKILEILDKLGIKRNVNNFDRTYYKTWIDDWGFGDEMLDYAISISAGKSSAMQYMNKILSNWKQQNIKTIEQAKSNTISNPSKDKSDKHSVSQEEINALFGNLEIVEV